MAHTMRLILAVLLMQNCVTDTRRAVQCGAGEMEEGGRCMACPQCSAGTGLQDICGYGQGSGLSCLPCPSGTFNSRPGPHRCLPCVDCSAYKRETVYKCRSVINTECGACLPHYYESFADMRDSDSQLYPCSHCREYPGHPECTAYRHSLSTTTPALTVATTDEVAAITAQSASEHHTLLRILIAVFSTLLLCVIALAVFLYVKMKLHELGNKPADAQIAEAMEMQELMDHQREENDEQRAHMEVLDVEAADRDERQIFERNVEVHAARRPNAPPLDLPAHPEVDINQNTIPNKQLQHKNVQQLLKSTQRSFSDPGPSQDNPGPQLQSPGTAAESPGTSGTSVPQRAANECGVAATIARQIHDCIAPDPRTSTSSGQVAMTGTNGQLAMAMPKVPSHSQGVVQNAIVGAVPSISHRVAVVNPISVAALKDAINTALNGPSSARQERLEPEHLVEYTPASTDNEDEGDDVMSLIESEASTIMLPGREPEENYDPSEARNVSQLHRNPLSSIEDNEARSMGSAQIHRNATPPRQMPDIEESPNVSGNSYSEGNPEHPPSPLASVLGQSPQINITINCHHTNAPAAQSSAPIYGAPTYINNNTVNGILKAASEDNKDQSQNATNASEQNQGSTLQTHDANLPASGNSPFNGSSTTTTQPTGNNPRAHSLFRSRPRSRSDNCLIEMDGASDHDDSSDETIPKTPSMTIGMFDTIMAENRHVQQQQMAAGNYPPTCRQSVQSPCVPTSSHFPVQETLYPV